MTFRTKHNTIRHDSTLHQIQKPFWPPTILHELDWISLHVSIMSNRAFFPRYFGKACASATSYTLCPCVQFIFVYILPLYELKWMYSNGFDIIIGFFSVNVKSESHKVSLWGRFGFSFLIYFLDISLFFFTFSSSKI